MSAPAQSVAVRDCVLSLEDPVATGPEGITDNWIQRHESLLLDLSEAGALLVMAMSPPRDHTCIVTVEWRDTPVVVAARIVRSEQRQVRLESATMTRMDYNVALEFLDMTPAATAAIRHIITTD